MGSKRDTEKKAYDAEAVPSGENLPGDTHPLSTTSEPNANVKATVSGEGYVPGELSHAVLSDLFARSGVKQESDFTPDTARAVAQKLATWLVRLAESK